MADRLAGGVHPSHSALSYEVIRFSGAHQSNPITQLFAIPGLTLQRLTTRQPDDSQIEVPFWRWTRL